MEIPLPKMNNDTNNYFYFNFSLFKKINSFLTYIFRITSWEKLKKFKNSTACQRFSESIYGMFQTRAVYPKPTKSEPGQMNRTCLKNGSLVQISLSILIRIGSHPWILPINRWVRITIHFIHCLNRIQLHLDPSFSFLVGYCTWT